MERDLTEAIAPARDAIEYEDVKFQNRFNEKSVYRGQPTMELEKSLA